MASPPSVGEKRRLLAAHPLLEHLDAAELDALVRHTRVERHAANTVIFRKGDPGLSMLAVVSGRVKISSVSAEGKEVVLNIISPGEIFGEIALLDGKERSANATAMGDVELMVLDRRDFLPFLRHNPEVCAKLFAVLCERLRRTSEQVEDLILVHSSRVAKTLLRLARDYGRNMRDGVLIDLRLSQRELGTHVGMTREALNRLLSEWRDQGLISTEDGLILIRDVDKLERLVDRIH